MGDASQEENLSLSTHLHMSTYTVIFGLLVFILIRLQQGMKWGAGQRQRSGQLFNLI